jgi:hypothetical protein
MFILIKHLGDYTLDKILFGEILKLILGRWEKALSEDIHNEVSTNDSCHLIMHVIKLNFGFNLEAGMKREHLTLVKNAMTH